MAGETAPALGRYMPMYPALYFSGGYAQDDQDRSYDQQGVDRDSAVPTVPGQTAFPEQRLESSFTWYFPLFESFGLPWLSSTLHTARVTLRHVRLDTEGSLRTYADAAQPLFSPLKPAGSGLGDTTLEFGSFLWGAQGWREGRKGETAALFMVSINLPSGIYEHEAPVNAGSNHWSYQAKLGFHARPWSGGFVDAAYAYRAHGSNYEPQFGGLAPFEQGDDRLWDISIGQRLWRGLYLNAFYTDRKGEANEYQNPQYAPNPPPPPSTTPPSDNYPTPGRYFDHGTTLSVAGLSLQYFVSQRVLASLHWSQPQEGRSGQFMLPYTNRQPAGCIVGASNCTTSPGASVLVDGLGPARSYASPSLMLSLAFNFGQGDAFTCVGCEE